jgi:amidase
MARTVRDAALLLGAMTGVDARDAATAPSQGRSETDYTRFLDPAGLKGARIGVARTKFFGYSDVTDRVIDTALDVLRREGAVLVDPANLATAGQFDDAELEVLLYDFKADLNRYLAELGPHAPVHTLADVIAFNASHRDAEMPFFGQELMLQAEGKGPLTDPAYRKAHARCRALSRGAGLDRTLDLHHLDAVVAPTQGPPWLIDLVNGDPAGAGNSTTPAAVAGYPSITVPAGQAFGLPIGLSFMGRRYHESVLVRLAYAFEQATTARRPPAFLPTVALPGEPADGTPG